jgi:1,4-alpha-glucan branching enzyme
MGNDNSLYYKTNYNFTLDGYTDAKKVFLAGSFNGWRKDELQMMHQAGRWIIPVFLSEGTHTYRFISDGKWFADPANPDKLPNEYNDFNSVIRMGKPYVFKLNGFKDARKIVLFGSFNNWKENELFMTRTATGWELPYTLGPGNYEYKLIVDGRKMGDSVGDGNLAVVIQPNFTFRLKGFANAKTVSVGGDMNNWNPTSFKMKREADEWIFKVHLNKGKHIYKFIVDGKWMLDPANKLWEENEYNTNNSVLWMESD